MQASSIILGLSVEGGVLVSRLHFRLFGKVEFKVVDFLVSSQVLACQFERLV